MSNFFELLNLSEKSYNIIKNIISKEFSIEQEKVIQNITYIKDKGIDFFFSFNKTKINIDVKTRNRAFSESEDVALEIWSNIEANKVGWALDHTKLTTYLLFFWEKDKIYKIYKFKDILEILENNIDKWMEIYYAPIQYTQNGNHVYHSQCIFIPIKIIENELFWKN